MSASAHRSNLEGGEDVILCSAEEKWRDHVGKVRAGKEALCLGLQKFLLFVGGLLERIGETSEVDLILATVGRAKLPEKKGLSDLEDQSLKVIEKKWLDILSEVRAGVLLLPAGFQEFMRHLGQYLIGRAEKPCAKCEVEKHHVWLQESYDSWEFKVRIPRLPCGDEQLTAWFEAGTNLIYEPSEAELPVEELMAKLPHQLLVDDPKKIVWEPAAKGRWLLVEAAERCPRVGARSYRGFTLALGEGERILTLPQYAILWHFGSGIAEIMDLETDTMLATRYGADGIVHAYASQAMHTLQFSVGEWRRLTTPHPKMGVRIARVIE